MSHLLSFSLFWLYSSERCPIPTGQLLRERAACCVVQRVSFRWGQIRVPALYRPSTGGLRRNHCAKYETHVIQTHSWAAWDYTNPLLTDECPIRYTSKHTNTHRHTHTHFFVSREIPLWSITRVKQLLWDSTAVLNQDIAIHLHLTEGLRHSQARSWA